MIRRNTLKKFLAIFISGVTFLNIIGLKNTKLKTSRKHANIKYKTEKELYNEINEKWIKPSEEKRKQQELAEKKKQEELKKVEEQKKKEESEWMTAICTAYTSDPSENGNSTGKTASGHILSRGGCAIPYELKLGTKLYIEGVGELIGNDRGNPNYIYRNGDVIRVDIFMNSKEAAIKFGVKKLKCKIIK